MSELTTEKVIGILADELCFETGGINEPHTNGCAQEAVAKAWLEQVKREAKVEALREAADDMYARANKNELIARADRYEGFYAGIRASILNETSALRDRAEQI